MTDVLFNLTKIALAICFISLIAYFIVFILNAIKWTSSENKKYNDRAESNTIKKSSIRHQHV